MLKKRSAEIFQTLLESSCKSLKLTYLKDIFDKSEKTLRNDIEEILSFVKKAGMRSVLFFDGQTLKVSCNQEQLIDIFYSMNTHQYKMSLEERKIYIIIALLTREGYCSMQQLADEMYVTRNTIVDDCKIVDIYLREYNVIFVAQSNKGIKITGNEKNINILLVDIFSSLIVNLQNKRSFFTEFIIKLMNFTYSFSDIVSSMEQFFVRKNVMLPKESFLYVAINIFIIVNRYNKNIKNNKNNLNSLDPIGEVILYVLETLNKDGSVNNSLTLYIEKIILMGWTTSRIQIVNDFELYGVICHFLLEVGNIIGFEFQTDGILVSSLILHLKSIKNWDYLNIDFGEIYNNSEFSNIRTIAQSKSHILEKCIKHSLNPYMVDSIVVHLCAALLRNRQSTNQFRVIISCPSSMATSKYVGAQIKNYFNFQIVKTMTTAEIESCNGQIGAVDFIISTVNMHNCALPLIVVNPLITVEDIIKIQRFTSQNTPHSLGDLDDFPSLSELLATYHLSDKKNIPYIENEVKKILQHIGNKTTILSHNLRLPQMLKCEYINVIDKCDWKQAMVNVSKKLITDGYFDNSYLDEVIQNTEEYGPYIVVNKEVAIAHGKKGSGVHKDGIALLVAKEGVIFDDTIKVTLFFFFSQKSDNNYLPLFKEIVSLSDHIDNIVKIKENTCPEDIYTQIVEILSNTINHREEM